MKVLKKVEIVALVKWYKNGLRPTCCCIFLGSHREKTEDMYILYLCVHQQACTFPFY